jgi:flagellar hook-length control protein FliK
MNAVTINVITAVDTADTPVKIQGNDQPSAQDFASELDRANSKDDNEALNAGQNQKIDKKAPRDDRPKTEKADDSSEDEPEKPKKVHGMPLVPVIINTQNVEVPPEVVQADAQNTASQEIAGVIPANGAVENQGVVQAMALQDMDAQSPSQDAAGETGQTQAEQVPKGTANTASGNTEVKQTAQAAADAEAFAGQALREIADLSNAPANTAAKDGEKPAEEPLLSMQQTAQAAQTVKTMQQAQQTAQPTGQNANQPTGQNVQQSGDNGPVQNTAIDQPQASAKDGTTGSDKQNAQDGSGEPGATQMQPAFGASETKVEFQKTAPAPEQPAVRQTVMTTIIDKISTAFGKETTEMVVQLKPEHLGGLSISLSMGESGLVAKMVTSEQSVHSMIHGEIGMLQEALREKGIPVVHMEVSWGQTSNTFADSQRGNGGHWTEPSYAGTAAVYDNMEEPANYYYNMSSYDVLTEQGGSVEFSA